jgi:Concanavalin A-like lectin/glucanases superfamily/Beta-galactosidase
MFPFFKNLPALCSAALLLISGLSSSAETVESEPLLHFNFKNAGGSQEITDLTGKVRASSPVPIVVERGAVHLDYGAQLTIPAADLPDFSKDFTLALWVAVSTKGNFGGQQYNPILSQGFYDVGVNIGLAVQDHIPVLYYTKPGSKGLTGILPIGGSYGGTTRYPDPGWIKGKMEIPDETWTFLTVVRAGSSLCIYENGNLVLEDPSSPPPIGPASQPLFLGAERLEKEKDNRVSGQILLNDLQVYGKALDAAAVAGLYDADKAAYLPPAVSFNPTRNYFPPEMRDFHFDLENKLDLVTQYEKNLPSDPYAGIKTMTSAIKEENLTVEGQPVYPVSAFPSLGYLNDGSVLQGTRYLRDFAAADVDLDTVPIWHPSIFWTDEGRYDWTKVDHCFQEVLKANPKAMILASLYVTPPDWFIKKYPEELEKYYYNDDTPSAGLKSWPNSAPLASTRWADLSCAAVDAFVRHVEAQPYASHVYGYHLPSGDSGEWFWPASFTGGMAGYSEPTRQGFRRWLQNKYHDTAALQKAWNDDAVTFETAEVPTPQQRKATERWIFRDAAKARSVFDFRQYMIDTTSALFERTMRTAKDASGWKKVVGTYYGYAMLFAGKGSTLQRGGLENLSRILSLDAVDILTSPIDYVHRRGTEPGMNIDAFAASARLHNKMIWREEDLRTHFWPRAEFGRMSDQHESIGAILRDFGHSLATQGSGLWFMAMAGNAAFHQENMMEAMRNASQAATRSLKDDRDSAAEVALILDEKSLEHLAVQTGNFIDAHTWGVYENSSKMGAPCDVYLLSDLAKMPDYKVYIFLDAYAPDAATVQMIADKVRRNNAVSVWCYAPGYITANGFAAAGMERLTGMKMKEDLRATTASLHPLMTEHPILKYAKTFSSYTFGPLFQVDDSTAQTLATVDGQPALAVKEEVGASAATSWRSVYTLMPLSKEMLMGICDYAGVHVYSRSFDVLSANRSYLMLHAASDGEKQLSLPGNYDVYDALANKKVASGISSFSTTLSAGDTRIYRLVPQK